MADTWYCRCEGRLRGPLSLADVQSLINEQKLVASDEVRRADQDWQVASKFPELAFPNVPAAPTPAPIAQPVPLSANRRPSPSRPTAPQLAAATPIGLSRYLPLLLLFTLVPLILYTFQAHITFHEQYLQSIKAHPEIVDRLQTLTDRDGNPKVAKDVFLAVFPGHKFVGAFLPFDTTNHWQFAAAAAIGFLLLIFALFPRTLASAPRILASGLFTGTIGIFLLLTFQQLAFHSNYHPTSAPGLVLYVFAKIIAVSYAAAEDPNNGFFFSFCGFTIGIGLCEEFVKFIPSLKLLGSQRPSWQKMLAVGLASGAGFGIAEAIIYSARYYNGIQGPQIYYVRFISCVALHAVWSGASAIMAYNHQHWLRNVTRGNRCVGIVAILAVPMILHGLYDTFLKLSAADADQNYHIMALVVAFASFAWLVIQIEQMHRRSVPRKVLPAQPLAQPALGHS